MQMQIPIFLSNTKYINDKLGFFKSMSWFNMFILIRPYFVVTRTICRDFVLSVAIL
jgi:hypothetical protein